MFGLIGDKFNRPTGFCRLPGKDWMRWRRLSPLQRLVLCLFHPYFSKALLLLQSCLMSSLALKFMISLASSAIDFTSLTSCPSPHLSNRSMSSTASRTAIAWHRNHSLLPMPFHTNTRLLTPSENTILEVLGFLLGITCC